MSHHRHEDEILSLVQTLREHTTILLAEQNARKALSVMDRAYVLKNGVIEFDGESKAIAKSPAVAKAYLGAA